MTQGISHEAEPAPGTDPSESIAQVVAPVEDVDLSNPTNSHAGDLSLEDGRERPEVDRGDITLASEFLANQLVVPDDAASLTRRSLGYRILHETRERSIALVAAGAVLIAGGAGTGVVLTKGGGKNNPRTTSTGSLIPGNTAGNGGPNPPETKPPVSESAPTALDLISVGKDQLSLKAIANPGDILPAVPVYDWLKDPKEDPAAFMDAFFANMSYYLSTRLPGNAIYSLDNMTDDPTVIDELKTQRGYVGAELTPESSFVWYWSDGPVEWKTTENSDGTLTITLASGTIFTNEFRQNPDDGWVAPTSLNKAGTQKITAFKIVLGKWTTSHPDVPTRGNAQSILIRQARI